MAFFSDLVSGLSEGLRGKAVSTKNPNFDLFYAVRPNDWYKTFPYYFEIWKETELVATFYLPIPPQQMSLQQVSTSEAYPTIGGVVTEVSAPVFYMITMSGTTGMSLNSVGVSEPGTEVKQRQTFDDLAGGPGIGSKLSRNIAKNVENIASLGFPEEPVPFFKYGSAVNTLSDAAKGDALEVSKFECLASGNNNKTVAAGVGKILGKMAKSVIGNAYDNKKASLYLNGFAWEHALKQFFLIYQRERSLGTVTSLHFVDTKSNNRYLCVPKNIQFTKSANLPYVSQYTISLKCWSDQKSGAFGLINRERKGPVDRFEGDLSEAFTISAPAAITSFYKLRVKLARRKDIGGAMARDAGGSTF